MSEVASSAVNAHRGRTRITARSLEKIVSAVTADAFDIDQKRVSLQIDDARGDLSLRVKTPLPVPSLDEIGDNPHRVESGGGPILERTHRAQEHIRQRVQEITGSTVARVMVEIIGADIRSQKRVK